MHLSRPARGSALLAASILLLFSAPAASAARGTEAPTVDWRHDWSEALFAQARAAKKLVILDLEAVWCHWCHVMDQKTYADPRVAERLRKGWVAAKVDQDSRPDLAHAYEDYGWPATVFFDARGRELAKRAGYIAPDEMVALLDRLSRNPVPEPDEGAPAKAKRGAKSSGARKAPTGGAGDNEGLVSLLLQQIDQNYDAAQGGWNREHRYLDRYFVEHQIVRALGGDKVADGRARQTLKAARALLDPVWGGLYQYSVGRGWKEPHFEKIMVYQSDALISYALASAAWGVPEDLEVAQKVASYLASFLSGPEGQFYTSQDADLVQGQHSADYFALGDAERRKKGVPRVDTHAYARENGWAIEGLLQLYSASGDAAVLARATQAARWVLAHRRLPGGGFSHDEPAPAGAKAAQAEAAPYLGDQVAMLKALVGLYAATGERAWLGDAEGTAGFIARKFGGAGGAAALRRGTGFDTQVGRPGQVPRPRPQGDENIELARAANLLHHYTGKDEYRAIAERALRFVETPAVTSRVFQVSGALLAIRELGAEPLHLTVVGRKDDSRAAALHKAALAYPERYRRIEWWDRREGPLPRADVTYPELKDAAAYVCTANRCSAPIREPGQLREKVDALLRPRSR